jgi:hypothetical protein
VELQINPHHQTPSPLSTNTNQWQHNEGFFGVQGK